MRPRLDIFLQYYRPHTSGLTNMAAELAEFSATHGFEPHVHAVGDFRENYRLLDVEVHKYRKTFRIDRAVFSAQLFLAIWSLRKRDRGIAHIHLPYPESFLLALLLPKQWKILVTYHCDAPANNGLSSIIAKLLDWSHTSLINRADFTVCSSSDYAKHSRLAKIIHQHNERIVPATSTDRAFGSPEYKVEGKRLVGFIGRPTHEKGVNVLLEAMALLPDNVVLLFAGPTEGLSDSVGFDQTKAEELTNRGKMIPLGFLSDADIPNFYASIDVLAFPSINSFEAFGIVQVEAMSAGVPVVATDLPGVRTVTQRTDFGEIVPPEEAKALADGIQLALTKNYDAEKAARILGTEYLYPVPHKKYVELYNELRQT